MAQRFVSRQSRHVQDQPNHLDALSAQDTIQNAINKFAPKSGLLQLIQEAFSILR